MNTEQDLLQRLVLSKKIMEKHDNMGRGGIQVSNPSAPMVEDYQPISASYNIPQEFMAEQRVQKPVSSEVPQMDRIKNSKLPDEIKKLMMEHPIQQPSMGVSTNTVLSDDLVEKASRLMNTKANGDLINPNQKRQPVQQIQEQTSKSVSGVSPKILKQIVKETVEDVLRDNGLLTESETKSNDVFKFRVGDHIFEGRVTKIKKIQK
jgi:hypothetical protein